MLTYHQKRRIKSLITALRSGKYKKTTNTLKSDNCFCVMGVACDLFRKSKAGKGWKWDQYGNFVNTESGLSVVAIPPAEVTSYFGISNANLYYVTSHAEKDKNKIYTITLLNKNDTRRMSFAKIADYLEKMLAKLEK